MNSIRHQTWMMYMKISSYENNSGGPVDMVTKLQNHYLISSASTSMNIVYYFRKGERIKFKA